MTCTSGYCAACQELEGVRSPAHELSCPWYGRVPGILSWVHGKSHPDEVALVAPVAPAASKTELNDGFSDSYHEYPPRDIGSMFTLDLESEPTRALALPTSASESDEFSVHLGFEPAATSTDSGWAEFDAKINPDGEKGCG